MWCLGEGIGWWPWIGGVWMFLFLAVIIGLIVWGITRLIGQDTIKTKNSALDLVKERYARGEISKEEFEQIKKDLF